MAANFWTSTHYVNWLRHVSVLMEEMAVVRHRDAEIFSNEELSRMQVVFVQLISSLARKTKLRQRIVATAVVYFRRFYLRKGFGEHDPRLIAPVALYLAAKVEEHTKSAKAVIEQMNMLYKADHSYPYNVTDIYNSEFLLLSELDFDLIVFHPYRPLALYCSEPDFEPLLHVAWAIVNDSYRTDVCLLYPPYLIAIACIYMAGTLKNKNMDDWIVQMRIQNSELSEIVGIISAVYAPNKNLKTSGRDSTGEPLYNKLQTYFTANKLKQEGKTGGPSGGATAN